MTDEDWFDEADGGHDNPVIANHGAVTPVPWGCAVCGEGNETLLDLSGGYTQTYTEDCAVCCRPNLLQITVDPETLTASITNELEYD